MNKQKERNKNYVIFSISILIILILMIVYNNYVLEKEHKYTVGWVYEVRATSSGYAPHFKYYVNGESYDGSFGIKYNDKSYIGKRFYVQFYPSRPGNCDILLDRPVPKWIKEAPSEGWASIPSKQKIK